MKEEDFKDLIERLISHADSLKNDKEKYGLIVTAVEALHVQRREVQKFKECAAAKVYETIYNRGGWKSDCKAAVDAINSIQIFSE